MIVNLWPGVGMLARRRLDGAATALTRAYPRAPIRRRTRARFAIHDSQFTIANLCPGVGLLARRRLDGAATALTRAYPPAPISRPHARPDSRLTIRDSRFTIHDCQSLAWRRHARKAAARRRGHGAYSRLYPSSDQAPYARPIHDSQFTIHDCLVS